MAKTNLCEVLLLLLLLLFSPEAPVNGDVVIEQDIRQASFGAVLRDYTDVGDLDTTADKFA